LSYQWKKQIGDAITDETGVDGRLTLSRVTASAEYYAVLTNTFENSESCSAKTGRAALTVNALPVGTFSPLP
ncbi:MAG: hypothetical protein CRN43_21795, partial [Candidatus Nephrothrix sp. EaCA]